MAGRDIGLGVIGCGGFGLYAVENFVQTPGVRLVALTDISKEAASNASERFDVPALGSIEELLADEDVDLVYIATPPYLHHPQSMAALAAGKHVICEKPLAVTIAQGEEMVAEARRRDLLMVVDLMQRYNPVFDAVRGLIDSRALGEFLHGSFDNYASDENLPPGHWFWDRSESGGIFIEHGVHFFDLFAGWLGPGRVESALVGVRPGSALEEQVGCTLRFGDGAWVDFYHGFHQPMRMDRQALRLLFEHGDVTLFEWIPIKVQLHAIVNEAQIRVLGELFPGARLDATAVYLGAERACRGRDKEVDVYQRVDMTDGEGDLKMRRYGELLRALFADQVAWIRDRGHNRRITEDNGLDSLCVASTADRLAHQGPETR